jgi:pre-mRNA-splicing factor RBM22/SLT11
MLDLQYGLPVQVRDSVLGVKETVPKNEANREYFIAANKARLERNDVSLLDYERETDPAAKAILGRLVTKKDYERNLAPPCSFYARGKCTRGDTCPYRHVLQAARYPSLQSYRDRYYGENDPAAEKIFDQNPELLTAAAGDNKRGGSSSTALFVQGIRSGLSDADINEFFTNYVPVSSVKMVADNAAAIVKFSNKTEAGKAAAQTLGVVDIRGVSVRVSWAKAEAEAGPGAEAEAEAEACDLTKEGKKKSRSE